MWELSELKGAGKSRPIVDIAVSKKFGDKPPRNRRRSRRDDNNS
jgi:hypothetical protein